MFKFFFVRDLDEVGVEVDEDTPLVKEGREIPPSTELWGGHIARFFNRCCPCYSRKASIEKAWAYFEHFTLPRRDADGKVPPGTTESTLYNPFTTPQKDLEQFGTGVAVYFATLQYLTITLFIAGLLYVPTMMYYASDGYAPSHSLTGALKYSLLCPAPFWAPCPTCQEEDWDDSPSRYGYTTDETGLIFVKRNECADLRWQEGLNHIFVMAFLVVAIIGLGFYQRKLERQYDEDVLTSQDFSIQVDNPPPDAKDPKEWKEFFSQFGEVAYVTVALNNQEVLSKLVKRRVIFQEIADNLHDPQVDTIAEIPEEMKGTQLYEKLISVDTECREVLDKDYPTSAIFVTFQKEQSQRACLQALGVGQVNISTNNTSALEQHHVFRSNLVLAVLEAPEPSAIRWQDLDESHAIKFVERAISTILTLGVIVAGFILVDHAYKRSISVAALVIAVMNVLMPKVFKRINAIESHQHEGTYQASLYWKICIFRWINTAVVTILIKPFTETISDDEDGLAPAVMAVLRAEMVTAPCLHMLDIVGQVKRHLLAPGAKNQPAMNSYFRGSPQNMGDKYTAMTKTIFLCFFYAVIFPPGFFFGSAALLFTYLTDKFALMRSWGPLPSIGNDIALLSRKIFLPLTLIVLAFMSELFYSSYPYDNLCVTAGVVTNSSEYLGTFHVQSVHKGTSIDEVTIEEGETIYSYCDQNFLSRMSDLLHIFNGHIKDWMSMDQEILTFVYGVSIVGIVGLLFLVNAKEDIQKSVKLIKGGYSTSERDSGQRFDAQEKISAYVPNVVNNRFLFPLLATDVRSVADKNIGWVDPTKHYTFYDLSRNVREMGFEGSKVLSTVEHFPASED